MKSIRKEVFWNCIPAMFCMVISGLNTIIDGLFIGRNIGEDGLAAINIAWPVPAFIISSGIGIGVGSGICYVSSHGKKQEKEAKEFLKNAFVFLACIGILYGIFFELTAPYLMKILGAGGRVYTLATEYTRVISAAAILQLFGAGLVPIVRNLNMPIQAMAATIIGVCSNIMFNTIFVVILQLGIKGAALGTILSQVITSIIALVSIIKSGVLKKSYEVHGVTRADGYAKQTEFEDAYKKSSFIYIRKILFGGIASFGISLLPTWVLVLTNYQCLSYGGSKTVACYAGISNLAFPAQSMLTGIADGAQPLFSMCAVMNDMKEKEAQIKGVVTRLVIFTSIVITLLLFVFAPSFHKVFSLSSENYKDFVRGLRITGLSLFFYGLNRLDITIMNGRKKHRKAAAIIYTEAIVYTPAFLFIMPMIWGITGIWMEPVAAAVLTEIIVFVWRES